jgi:hypothetical protein
MILKEENIEGKGHHIGHKYKLNLRTHKYKLNFRTTQQEIDTILLVQNYTNPKFNCNFNNNNPIQHYEGIIKLNKIKS